MGSATLEAVFLVVIQLKASLAGGGGHLAPLELPFPRVAVTKQEQKEGHPYATQQCIVS